MLCIFGMYFIVLAIDKISFASSIVCYHLCDRAEKASQVLYRNMCRWVYTFDCRLFTESPFLQ